MDEKEMMNKIKYLIKKKRPLEDILLETGLKEYEIFGFVEMLKQNGWQAEYKDGFFVYQKEQLIKDRDVYKMAAGEKHKLLFISDTHLGSKYDRLDILRYLYDLAEDEEINTYRQSDHDFLMSVRNNSMLDNKGQPTSEFWEVLSDLEKRFDYAKKNTSLPDVPNIAKINELKMLVNEMIINGSI